MNNTSARNVTKAMIVIIGIFATNIWGQKITNRERGTAQSMLEEISKGVSKHYYDPALVGANWDATVEATKQKINAADSVTRAVSEIAVALDSLHDSHTFLIPPSYDERFEYGWKAQMVGDHCFIVRVRPGSDAEKKGVKPGDELIALNGFAPDRQDFHNMQYFFLVLHPQARLRLDLRNPAGEQRQVEVAAKVIQKKALLDLSNDGNSADTLDLIQQEENEEDREHARFVAVGDVGVLKFPLFFYNASEIDGMIGKAGKYKALVLDLRGDPGGSVDTLKYLIGDCFDKDVTIGDRVGRSKRKTIDAKRHNHPFTGKLIVLIDSKSASAAELFARVVQIQKRGAILGDRSSGSVMEARHYIYKSGVDTVVFYGASITDANMIMTDGKSLERNGVIPDEVTLPSAKDIASGSDPVLAEAVKEAGGTITPEAAGKLFPYKWPKL